MSHLTSSGSFPQEMTLTKVLEKFFQYLFETSEFEIPNRWTVVNIVEWNLDLLSRTEALIPFTYGSFG